MGSSLLFVYDKQKTNVEPHCHDVGDIRRHLRERRSQSGAPSGLRDRGQRVAHVHDVRETLRGSTLVPSGTSR
jgi:hypothetical protein